MLPRAQTAQIIAILRILTSLDCIAVTPIKWHDCLGRHLHDVPLSSLTKLNHLQRRACCSWRKVIQVVLDPLVFFEIQLCSCMIMQVLNRLQLAQASVTSYPMFPDALKMAAVLEAEASIVPPASSTAASQPYAASLQGSIDMHSHATGGQGGDQMP